jgi:hypothetical protein
MEGFRELHNNTVPKKHDSQNNTPLNITPLMHVFDGLYIECPPETVEGEYISTFFTAYCQNIGVQRQITAGYLPQQNGIAERKNRTLLEAIRSVVQGTKVPKYLWEEIVKAVNYI